MSGQQRKRRLKPQRRFIVQTILSQPQYAWVQRMADSEGLSVSSWLRRRLMLEMGPAPRKGRDRYAAEEN